jgi:hypothetical protein
MNFKTAVKESINRINWSYGRGDVVKINFEGNGIGTVKRKFQYGGDIRDFYFTPKATNKNTSFFRKETGFRFIQFH